MSLRLNEALHYASLGWQVLPLHNPVVDGGCSCARACQSVGKHPRTAHGVYDATTDEDQIRDWWRRDPEANVGVATGTTSGLLVLDVDPRNGGNESLLEQTDQYGAIPATLMSSTGGGGMHWWFKCPDGVPRSTTPRPGLDVKGDGGYVVAPPSLHASGKPYTWQVGPGDAELALPPDWLLSLRADPSRHETTDEASVPKDSFCEGERNQRLTQIAGLMRRQGLRAGAIQEQLLDFNRRLCVPPLRDEEVSRVALAVERYPTRPDEMAAEAKLEWLNRRHAVVKEQGKTTVMTQEHVPTLRRRVLTRSSFQDFRNFYLNDPVIVGYKKDGDPKLKSLGSYWLTHPDRRQYEGVTFAPGQTTTGYYNLWTDFNVKPREGDWSLMKDHLRNVICSGDDTVYQWLYGWMAACVQRPGQAAEVAIVLRGDQGVGKGILGREFGKLFGQHFIHIANPRHLMGNFNAHLQDAVVVFADEAFVVGDKQLEGVLKMLITEEMIPIERKGRDVIFARNVIHLIMASNSDWVVPAGLDERRFLVLDVNNDHKQDGKYFGALINQMESGGREAMLYDLRRSDLSTFKPREVPQTEALREQKILSMQPSEKWWFQKLDDGCLLPRHDSWQTVVERQALCQDFADVLGRGVSAKAVATTLGIFLKKVLPGAYPRSFQRAGEELPGLPRRRRHWGFPSLEECRAYFDELTRTKHVWPDPQSDVDADESTRAQPCTASAVSVEEGNE